MAYYEGEISPIGCGNNGGMGFGGNGWGDLAALIVVAGLFGWGNGGFGGGFGGGRGGVGENYVLATDFANIERKLDGVNNGLCDGFYAVNTGMLNGFASVQQTLCQGFNGIERSLAQNGYQAQAGFNALGAQIAQCCCDTRAAIADVKYANERNACDIIRAGQDNTRAILDYLTGEKISALQAENSGLRAQISNDRQSQYIVSQLKDPCPVPAYLTCDPRVPFNYGHFNNNGCGCGCN